MKILFALPPSSNPLIQELSDAVQQYGAQVEIDCDAFWDKKKKYDIIHIHWPEALRYWKEPDDEALIRLEESLLYWKNTSKIVVTRHNVLPHQHATPAYTELYKLVFKYAHATIHMGESSLVDYREMYSQYGFVSSQLQAVIPHPIYTSFPNMISEELARKKLGIPQKSFVVLVFGKVRNEQETKFILETFEKLQIKDKLLLVPHWYFSDHWLRRKYERILAKLHPAYQLTSKRINNEDVQLYFNSANILFIQRFQNLNSGNLILGFTFGKVVVGPEFGVTGEILQQTNNPFYRSGDSQSAAQALLEGKSRAKKDIGKQNLQHAQKEWNPGKIGELHFHLYSTLLEKSV
jgi:hypothetical protein